MYMCSVLKQYSVVSFGGYSVDTGPGLCVICTGIDVLESDRRLIKQARKEVESQAQKMLEQGMETQVKSVKIFFFSKAFIELSFKMFFIEYQYTTVACSFMMKNDNHLELFRSKCLKQQ